MRGQRIEMLRFTKKVRLVNGQRLGKRCQLTVGGSQQSLGIGLGIGKAGMASLLLNNACQALPEEVRWVKAEQLKESLAEAP